MRHVRLSLLPHDYHVALLFSGTFNNLVNGMPDSTFWLYFQVLSPGLNPEIF